MKLASLILLTLLGGVASADNDRSPVDPYGAPTDPFGAPHARGTDPFGPPNARNTVDPFAPNARPADSSARPRMAKRNQLRQLILRRFDRNRDGQLQPQERQQAAKALRKLARRMEHGNVKQPRKQRFSRYDLNRDGNIGPGEMPPAIADELRPLDQNGDGWLHGDELP